MNNLNERSRNLAQTIFENQFFRLDDDGKGKPRYFDVAAMEKYARRNLPIVRLKAEPDRAAKMLTAGTVNAEYVLELTGRPELAPILFCLGAGKNGGDLIVDGNHRYVAWTLAHHERGGGMMVPAFLFEQEDWSQFVVSKNLVPQLGLFDPAIGDLEAQK